MVEKKRSGGLWGAELKNIMLDCFLLRQATHMAHLV
jgi:hypothetical protein